MNDYKQMDPLGSGSNSIRYGGLRDSKGNPNINHTVDHLDKILASNKIFRRSEIDWYNKVVKYGNYDLFNIDKVTREVLFFTKPDLSIFSDGNPKSTTFNYTAGLSVAIGKYPFFVDASIRNLEALKQLQYSIKDVNGVHNPFMYLLTNSVQSKLDLPGISADSRESTSNIMGVSIQYRSHSLKSDNGYDFSLTFEDTPYLEVYTLVKAYDEYMRLLKTGEIEPSYIYIENKIIPEQFSIYKFLIGDDGETILYYAKLTGCYFTDVPRADFGDPENFKYSVSFHAQFVEDNNPIILEEFNRVASSLIPNGSKATYSEPYNFQIAAVNNEWARAPQIVRYYATNDKRVAIRGTNKEYRLKWINVN